MDFLTKTGLIHFISVFKTNNGILKIMKDLLHLFKKFHRLRTLHNMTQNSELSFQLFSNIKVGPGSVCFIPEIISFE